MKKCWIMLVLPLVIVAVVPLQAADACPWFTQGSAARILGGDVVPTIMVSSAKEGFCKYSRGQEASNDSIEIYVMSAMPKPCAASSEKVPGIGNEAVTCVLKVAPNGAAYQVDSRVREVHFTVLLQIHDYDDRETRPDLVRQAAEQVAGNLF